MYEIVALFKNGWSVSEIARDKGISLSRVYFVLEKWGRMSESDIFIKLEEIGVPIEESVAITSALLRYQINSVADLAKYLEENDLLSINRIGPKRAAMLNDILERENYV